MWKLKGCPKCNGDLYIDGDMNGWFEECLQCGYLRDLRNILQGEEQPKEQQHKRKREFALTGQKKAINN